MNKELTEKVAQYRVHRKNLFSYTEKMVVALCCPDLYRELMPANYLDDPMGAFYHCLNAAQQKEVMGHHWQSWLKSPGDVEHVSV